jgi:hypothetical protein
MIFLTSYRTATLQILYLHTFEFGQGEGGLLSSVFNFSQCYEGVLNFQLDKGAAYSGEYFLSGIGHMAALMAI